MVNYLPSVIAYCCLFLRYLCLRITAFRCSLCYFLLLALPIIAYSVLVLSVFSASSSYHCVALVLHVIVGLQALPINAFSAIDIIVFCRRSFLGNLNPSLLLQLLVLLG